MRIDCTFGSNIENIVSKNLLKKTFENQWMIHDVEISNGFFKLFHFGFNRVTTSELYTLVIAMNILLSNLGIRYLPLLIYFAL